MRRLDVDTIVLGGYWDDYLANLTATVSAWVKKAQAVGVNAVVNVATQPAVAGSDAVKAAIAALQTAGQNAMNAVATANAYGLTTQAQTAQTAGQAALALVQQGSALAAGSDATSWMSQAQTATTAANTATAAITQAMQSPTGAPGAGGGGFNPGTASDSGSMPTGGGGYGGGGSGGGDPFADEGSGQSDAVQRFRESGGAWDPFEEEGGGGGGGYAPAAADPFADDADSYEQSDSGAYTEEELREFLDSSEPSDGGGSDGTVLGDVSIKPTRMGSYLAGLDILGGMATRSAPRASTPVKPITVAPPPAVVNPARAPLPARAITSMPTAPTTAPTTATTSAPATPPATATDAPPTAAPPPAFDPGSGGGGGGFDDAGDSAPSGGRGGNPFDEEAMAEEGEEAMDPDSMDTDELLQHADQLQIDKEALEEEEDALLGGLSFEWQDIFNPAGAGIRAYQEYSAPGPDASQMGHGKGGVVRGAPSPQIAAQLAASKAKLAQLQKAYAAAAAGRLSASQAAAVVPMAAPAADAADSAIVTNTDGTTSIVGLDDLELGDEDEIIMQQWQKQITDQPADLERRRGSVHRGGAYLQDITYPPHGASGGQEGGSMRPEEEIEVLGEDYNRGLDILGAVPATKPVTVKTQSGAKVTALPRAGFVTRVTPAGNKHTSLVVKKPKQGNDKASIKNAKDAGNRAVSVAAKLKQRVSAATKVKGYDEEHELDSVLGDLLDEYGDLDITVLGVAATVAKSPVAAKGKAAPISKAVAVKMGQMADQLAKKGKETLAKADKHAKLVTTAQTKLKAGTKAVASRLDPSKSTKIHGDEDELEYDIVAAELGVLHDDACDDVLGDMLFGAVATPDPSNPGFLTDGTPDPAYGDSTSGGGTTTASGVPGPPDYGCGPAPKGAPPMQAGIDYTPDPGADSDISVYSSTGEPGTVPLPEGAVIYDGSQPMPEKAVGSYTYFHRKLPTGAAPKFGDGSGFFWGDDNSWKVWCASCYNDGIAIDTRTKHPTSDEARSLPFMSKASNDSDHKWGPLCGNPRAADFAGIRYDQGGNQWFWFYDKAPSWATAADKMKRDNQALLDYQALYTAAQTDYTTQQLQDRLDAQNAAALAKTQAAEDAATARQQQQEQADAAHQAELQAVADQQAAQQQQLADEASYRQQQIEWEAESRAQQSDTESAQAQMMTQAQIDQQAMESQARIEAQAAETAARIQQMQAGGGDEGVYATDDYTNDGMDEEGGSLEDAKDALDSEEVMGAGGGRIPGHMRGSDRMRARRDDRRG